MSLTHHPSRGAQTRGPVQREVPTPRAADAIEALSRPATVAISIPSALAKALADADVQINGSRPWDIRVYDPRLASRVRTRGLVGLGEAYVDGWWECDAVHELFARLLDAKHDVPRLFATNPLTIATYLHERLFNLQNRRRAAKNIKEHYDQGNDLFEATLDSRMQYTCGYWSKGATNLEEAQLAKLDLICRKLELKPGMRVLEFGFGWGGLARHMAEHYGCKVVGYSISAEQVSYASRYCAGFDVELKLADYRTAQGTFDRIVSVGMFEHVGPKNYRTYMKMVHQCLADDGLALIHFFASQKGFPNLTRSEVNWVTRYIFPGLVIPSLAQVGVAIEGLLVTEDVQNFGADYYPTLMAWSEKFHQNWPTIRDRYGERYYRVWQYYLLSAAGAFRARRYQLWQFVFSKNGVPGGYRSVR